MPRQHQFDDRELAAIHEHNEMLIEACNKALINLQDIPKLKRTPHLANQIQYWKNIRAGYRWSDELANQRKVKPSNVDRPTV